jgi:ubiquinone/menaquinone biosynthesis C-methylase UbiE
MAGDAENAAQRVRDAYERRAELGLDGRYTYWSPANLLIYQSRERVLLDLFGKERLLPLSGRSVLDVGCGDGNVLLDLVRYGAEQSRLAGVDLLPDRVERAASLLPKGDIRLADAQALPFKDQSFDLVLGFTLLSSIVEDGARRRVAAEMARVAVPGGLIVLYDFWVNPFNRDVRPLRRGEVGHLFPARPIGFRSLTLAPPLVRFFAERPGGWFAATLLEMLPFLRSHFLAAVRC